MLGTASLTPHTGALAVNQRRPLEGAVVGAGVELLLMDVTIPEKQYERGTGDEAADMGEIGDAARILGLHTEREDSVDELDRDPVPDHPPGRNQYHDRDAQHENGPDLAVREELQIGGQHPGDRSRCAD